MIGRSAELDTLNEAYRMNTGSVSVLYGRKGLGKTTLLREFVKDKQALWFYCLPGSVAEQKNRYIQAVTCQTNKALMAFSSPDNSLTELIKASVRQMSGTVVMVFDEFQHLVKASPLLVKELIEAARSLGLSVRLQVILSSSSVYFVENGLVSAVGGAALYFSSFIKLKELSFAETVGMFKQYSVEDIIKLYAITGGVPGYLACFCPEKSLEENISEQIITESGPLHREGHEFVKGELRETAVYNTILSAIASGSGKLNDLHGYTGYGRDKISVYIKNLTEREIVEKVFSYDSQGYANTKKGLYRIKDSYVDFWYRFLYREYTALHVLAPEEFYNRYIKDQLREYASQTFTKVAMEYLELMGNAGRLPFAIEKRGSWYGKEGNVNIIGEGEGKCLVGQTNSTERKMTLEEYEKLLANAALAGIRPQYVFLFSLGGFEEALYQKAKEDNTVTLIGLEDL